MAVVIDVLWLSFQLLTGAVVAMKAEKSYRFFFMGCKYIKAITTGAYKCTFFCRSNYSDLSMQHAINLAIIICPKQLCQ